ncbi:hypothetical protein T484DRAFT_1785327, partial [Baffinella frigidus]
MSSTKMTTAEAAVELEIDMDTNPTLEELKKAYRQLALRWHPDKNEEDTTAKFQRISNAYARLQKAVEGEESEDDDDYYGEDDTNMDAMFEMFER